MPVPALPARSVTVLLSSTMKLLGSVTFAVGVRVAVQVAPPSLLARLDSVPLATLTSASVKLFTGSLKAKVTSDV
ncbi:Unknown protein sequence [Pseudomonas amygdali pv. eriobotryae]|uniref:Uncharacterized protein n=1 Tax=Pseudomonas amygdali pv. eriobotryae TaxID=129137 RepID=A0A0P9R0D6_PSEA0|nr:Unknown protein sequence [Pseudomonas amygdali pv. eriobotryae]